MSAPLTPEDIATRVRVARWIWKHYECRPPGCNQGEFAQVLGVADSVISEAKKAARPGYEGEFSVSAELLFRLRKRLKADINDALDRDPLPDDEKGMRSRLGAIWADSPDVEARRQSKAAGDPTPKRRRHAGARGA